MSKTGKGKIFQYIAEILVITLGILGAFALENWNNHRKNMDLQREVLLQIASDLEDNLGDIKADYDYHMIAYKSNLRVQSFIDGDSAYQEDLCFDFHHLQKDEYSYPINSGYVRLRDLGIHTLKNNEIKTKIEIIYENMFPRIVKGPQSFYPDITELFRDYYEQNFRVNHDENLDHTFVLNEDTIKLPIKREVFGYPQLITYGFIPLDYKQLKQDHLFKQLLVRSMTYRGYKISRYGVIVENAEELIDLIYEEVGVEREKD